MPDANVASPKTRSDVMLVCPRIPVAFLEQRVEIGVSLSIARSLACVLCRAPGAPVTSNPGSRGPTSSFQSPRGAPRSADAHWRGVSSQVVHDSPRSEIPPEPPPVFFLALVSVDLLQGLARGGGHLSGEGRAPLPSGECGAGTSTSPGRRACRGVVELWPGRFRSFPRGLSRLWCLAPSSPSKNICSGW